MKKLLLAVLSVLLCVAFAFSVGCAGKKTFKVEFDPDGGVRVSGGALVQEVESAEQITPPVLEKEGFSFVDWDKPLSGIKSDTTVKAIWEKNMFTVTFSVGNGIYQEGSGATIQTVSSGSQLILPVFVRDGYTLSWDKKISDIKDDCTVNGIWTPNDYKISFVDANGEKIAGLDDVKVTFDEQIPSLPTLDSEEKRFIGWRLSNGAPISQGQVYSYAMDVSVKPIWTDYRRYSLGFDLDGGVVNGLPSSYSEGKQTVIPTPTKVGHEFLGWVQVNGSGEEITSPSKEVVIEKGTTGDRLYKAKWMEKQFVINFLEADGSSISGVTPVKVKYGQAIPTLPSLSKSDKKFGGWKLDSGETIVKGQVYKFDADITVKAIWTNFDEFTIKIDLDGGSANNLPTKYTEGRGATIGQAQKTGYNFDGWVELDANGKEISSPQKTVTISNTATGDKFFKAKWTAKEYSITFANLGGTPINGVSAIKVSYGQKIPTLPTLANGERKFAGWDLSNGEAITTGQVYNFTDNITVYPHWIDFAKYVITVKLNGGDPMMLPTTYTEGKGATINGATRKGYTFKGWVETDQAGNHLTEPKLVINISKTATGDKYFEAIWEVKNYTVNFISISGTVSIQTMTFTYGQKIESLPTVSGNEGTFVCWKYNGNEIKVGDLWMIDASGIDVEAEFIRKFVFTFAEKGKCGVKSIKYTVTTGSLDPINLNEFSPIELPTAKPDDTEEYRFSCWKYKNKNGEWIKLAANTLISTQTLSDLDYEGKITINVELVAFFSSNWSGFY